MELGMEGEGLTDDSIWIVKTHFPERIGYLTFKTHKCVLIVRSPIDCVASLFNMIATGSHNKSMSEVDLAKVQDIWGEFVN